jgi:chloramphenicol-sensitive protein RarD
LGWNFYFKEEITLLQMFSYFLILISVVVFNKKIIFGKKNKPQAIAEVSKSL